MLEGIGISNDFQKDSNCSEITARTDKWDCIKFKSFCPAKETNNKIKKQSTGLEKIFVCYS
jgi:hypothetical protein